MVALSMVNQKYKPSLSLSAARRCA